MRELGLGWGQEELGMMEAEIGLVLGSGLGLSIGLGLGLYIKG